MFLSILVAFSLLSMCYAGDTSTSTLPCATVALRTLPATVRLTSGGLVKHASLTFNTGTHSGTESFLIPYETDTAGPYTLIHANNLAEKAHAMTVHLNVSIHYSMSGTCSYSNAAAIQIWLSNDSPVTDYCYLQTSGESTADCMFTVVVAPSEQHFYRAVLIALPPTGCTINALTNTHFVGLTADC